MAQALNKRHRVVRSLFVIMGTLRHEPGLLILLQFSHGCTIPPYTYFSHCLYTSLAMFAIITGGTLIPQT